MQTETKTKRLWLDVWEIEELETWFADMALQGWHLSELRFGRAIFKKGKPQQKKYRCDTFKINELIEKSKLEENLDLGWQYIGSWGYLHVFCEGKDPEIQEIYPDSRKHADSLAILKRSVINRALLGTLLVLCYFVFQWQLLQNFLVNNYLDSYFALQLLIATFICFPILHMYLGVYRISILMKKLRQGKGLNHNSNYKKKLKRRKFIVVNFIIIVSIFIVTSFIGLGSSDRYQAIPEDYVPVVTLSTILEKEGYSDIEYRNDRDRYSENSSILVPKQYELHQSAEGWLNGVGPYQPSIWSKRYKVRTEWLAKMFVSSIVEQNTNYHGAYELVNDPQFDELWLKDDEVVSSFIARIRNEVFVVDYYGMESVEVILGHSFWLQEK
ncbi:MAG: DUF2812 domain-containing protein [Anaerobacillus sp.]|uniref:DUF2812 domain-containing protein n=1 Tax=Anaerobacillus sp. TaxID=1872506 RepID=UPI00391D8909